MSFRSFFHRSQPHRQVRRENHWHATRRPRFETFEDRRMLSFTPAMNYAVGTEPQAVVTADFNNDGHLDLVTANAGSNNVRVLLGSANGTFGPAIDSPAGYRPKSIAVGDFDDDGNLDLAAVNGYGYSWLGTNGVVSVMFGSGNGSFEPPSEIVLDQLSTPMSVAVGDFNEDQLMDLVVATNEDYYYPGDVYWNNGRASVLLSNSDRSFSGPTIVFEGGYSVGPAVVTDFNGDDNQDVLVGADDYIRILLGDGEGNLASVSDTNWLIGEHGSLASMAVGDVDDDGVADLVAQDFTNVKVRLGNGLGGFEPPPGGLSYAAGNSPRGVALGDFDRDGAIDVAVANYGSSNVSILRGRGDGTFAPPEQFAAGTGTYAIAVGDFNGDDWLDIATANESGNNASVRINDRIWAPTPPPVYISVTDASVTEGKRGTKYLTFTVSLSEASTGPVTVNYATQNGTASVVSDYQSQSGTLSFAAGETTKTVRIAIYGDSTVEPDESFQLVLNNSTGNAVISDQVGIGLILNDDLTRGPGKKK